MTKQEQIKKLENKMDRLDMFIQHHSLTPSEMYDKQKELQKLLKQRAELLK